MVTDPATTIKRSADSDAIASKKSKVLAPNFDTAEVREIIASLTQSEPRISQNYLYDHKGSDLYEDIVAQTEYYLLAAEKKLVTENIYDIAKPHVGEDCQIEEQLIVELGAGAGHRTHPLINAMASHARKTTYAPTDISPSALVENRKNFDTVCGMTANLHFKPLIGRHEETTAMVAGNHTGVKTFVFCGSSLGNYFDEEIVELLKLVGGVMGPKDRIILGVDREHGPGKPGEVIRDAYNDKAGFTAAFTLNALTHVNRVAGFDFDEAQWRHDAIYDSKCSAIITHVEARVDVTVHSAEGKPLRSFKAGEKIFMEQSRKFNETFIKNYAKSADLEPSRIWTDSHYLIVELRPLAAK